MHWAYDSDGISLAQNKKIRTHSSENRQSAQPRPCVFVALEKRGALQEFGARILSLFCVAGRGERVGGAEALASVTWVFNEIRYLMLDRSSIHHYLTRSPDSVIPPWFGCHR